MKGRSVSSLCTHHSCQEVRVGLSRLHCIGPDWPTTSSAYLVRPRPLISQTSSIPDLTALPFLFKVWRQACEHDSSREESISGKNLGPLPPSVVFDSANEPGICASSSASHQESRGTHSWMQLANLTSLPLLFRNVNRELMRPGVRAIDTNRINDRTNGAHATSSTRSAAYDQVFVHHQSLMSFTL
jgi:hypothetical protein